jgi:FkbM family methyltransferase
MDELQPHERKFLERLDTEFELSVGEPPVVYDVGANVGQYAKACKEIWPDCHVVCFEPQPLTFMQLAQNLGDVDNIRFYKAALSRARDLKPLHFGGDADQSASLHVRNLEGVGQLHPEQTIVQTARLDEVVDAATRIDLLKLDVEGHELSVMEGAGKLLTPKAIKFIHWELNSCALDSRVFFRDYWRLLLPAGYDILEIFSDGHWEWIEEYDPELENFAAHREFLAAEAS